MKQREVIYLIQSSKQVLKMLIKLGRRVEEHRELQQGVINY